ncbi:hypothetical protein DYB37_008993 [Aphanomyces astaci]|uniref:Uncharacterized protein n=2 Tax=Aphanomyces astaci TaxID=112090 RepID=A0A397A7P6_APHAT|nr:hypothetical protein DYB36_007539 [Aphanomyces astaci]RHY42591.1 hypothetical protein DYB34_012125 [Aphanomyces astaci]RHY51931.1 hypothetical protein DYB30_010850 [Aphanomyces astaci]RHZ00788.1 hypothetical protein DYB35_003872 [Aphanomyces astaci]RHZ02148.1 hypothetical protein DYB31_003299 [Aphanomyces astaci]
MAAKVGVSMSIRFRGEEVHAFSVHPEVPEDMYNASESETVPHAYGGKEDGGALPEPKQTGDHALLATAIKVHYATTTIQSM